MLAVPELDPGVRPPRCRECRLLLVQLAGDEYRYEEDRAAKKPDRGVGQDAAQAELERGQQHRRCARAPTPRAADGRPVAVVDAHEASEVHAKGSLRHEGDAVLVVVAGQGLVAEEREPRERHEHEQTARDGRVGESGGERIQVAREGGARCEHTPDGDGRQEGRDPQHTLPPGERRARKIERGGDKAIGRTRRE